MKDPERLNDDELGAVAGGDDGDSISFSSADQVQYMYFVGQHIEVYTTLFHVSTKGATVTSRYPVQGYDDDTWYAAYDVQYDNGSTGTRIWQDEIQSS